MPGIQPPTISSPQSDSMLREFVRGEFFRMAPDLVLDPLVEEFLLQDSLEFCDELLMGGAKLAKMRQARQQARVARTPAEAAVHSAEANHGVAVGAAAPHSTVPHVAVTRDPQVKSGDAMGTTSHGYAQKSMVEQELKARMGKDARRAVDYAEQQLLLEGGAASASARSIELERPDLTATDVLHYAASQYPGLLPTARAAAPQTDAQRAIFEATIADRERRFADAKARDEEEGKRISGPMGGLGASSAAAGGGGGARASGGDGGGMQVSKSSTGPTSASRAAENRSQASMES